MVVCCDRMTGPGLKPSASAPEWPPRENGSRKNEPQREMLHRNGTLKLWGQKKWEHGVKQFDKSKTMCVFHLIQWKRKVLICKMQAAFDSIHDCFLTETVLWFSISGHFSGVSLCFSRIHRPVLRGWIWISVSLNFNLYLPWLCLSWLKYQMWCHSQFIFIIPCGDLRFETSAAHFDS